MKQLEVQIMGQSYLLGCPEGGDARLLQAVQKVDVAMCKIRDAGKVKARDRIAVLAALNLAFEVSERQLADAAPPPRQEGEQAGTTGLPPAPALSETESVQLAGLLGRLDAALSNDGHLL